jgi:hypothetical protein
MADQQTGTPGERAEEALEFIRTTMARSATFTAVPGRGGILMGLVALVAAWISARQPTQEAWLTVWLVAAGVAGVIAVEAIRRKAKAAGMPFWSEHGRRFAQGLLPALVAGAALTLAVVAGGYDDLLPALWLLLYGAGVIAGASGSIPLLTGLGIGFMAIGLIALVLPAIWGTWCLAAGFGGLNLLFGVAIAKKHGG